MPRLDIVARWLELVHLTHRAAEPLDWVETARSIEALDLETLYTGDQFFPDFLEDLPADRELDPPAALGVYRILRLARESLCGHAAVARHVLETPAPAVAVLDANGWRTYLTRYADGMADATLPYAFAALVEGGLAEATGFTDAAQYAAIALEDRTLSFSREELLGVRGAHAWLFAEDAARTMVSEFATTSAEHWPEVWLRPLRESTASVAEVEAERALFRFLGATLAIALVLVRRAGIDEEEWLVEMVDLIDTQTPPAERTADLARHLLADDTTFLADALAVLDSDPEGEILRNLTASTGIAAAHSLSIELCIHVLLPGLLGIASLAGDRLADIRPHITDNPVAAREEPRSSTDSSLIDEIGWCAFATFDWTAAEDAIERRPVPERKLLRTDLDVVRHAMDGKRMGYATRFVACGLTYLCGLDEARDGWTLVLPLRRLGHAGVLGAAGAAAWG